ncbi:hypothetical protein HAX54_050638, partial [Datura stramonium]|nr:hypothetical protein [Datura stramonium]
QSLNALGSEGATSLHLLEFKATIGRWKALFVVALKFVDATCDLMIAEVVERLELVQIDISKIQVPPQMTYKEHYLSLLKNLQVIDGHLRNAGAMQVIQTAFKGKII